MENDNIMKEIERWMSVIGKSVGLLTLNSIGIHEKELVAQVYFLNSLGFTNKEISSLLDIGENSVRAHLSTARKEPRKKKSKKQKKIGRS